MGRRNGGRGGVKIWIETMPLTEDILLVAYDVERDRIRRRVFEACKDYGLIPVQYSTFVGRLTRNRREELAGRIEEALDGTPGNVLLMPVCEADFKKLIRIGEKLSLTQSDVSIVV